MVAAGRGIDQAHPPVIRQERLAAWALEKPLPAGLEVYARMAATLGTGWPSPFRPAARDYRAARDTEQYKVQKSLLSNITKQGRGTSNTETTINNTCESKQTSLCEAETPLGSSRTFSPLPDVAGSQKVHDTDQRCCP